MSTATAAFRKPDDLDDLRSLAFDVLAAVPVTQADLGARQAAGALAGVAAWIGHRQTPQCMRVAMANLARHTDAWRVGAHPFSSLPLQHDGKVSEDVALVATIASGLVRLFGLQSLRAAMAFWATETDPAAWRAVVEV